MEIKVIKDILEANDRIAIENRKLFDEKGLFVVNFMGTPGAGKTTLLEQTIQALDDIRIGVIEGDIQSSMDAERIQRTGAEVVQINTGGACHLDGNMIRDALDEIDLNNLDLFIVENVGNLVCPAEFRLGEDIKVMIISVTEGDEKPLKYPLMFSESKVLLINKIDLLPYTNCDLERLKRNALSINSHLKIFPVSLVTGDGLSDWYKWLRACIV